MDRWSWSKLCPTVTAVGGLFFPQRAALGLDARESTPGFKRQVVVLNAETQSEKRAAYVIQQTLGFTVSPNTIGRLCQEAGEDLATAQADDWRGVLAGEVVAPEVAIIMNDGGRMRTRLMNMGPGVHLGGKGWNETKNAILVSASSTTSEVDPQPEPPACFLNLKHVAKLVEMAKVRENAGENDDLPILRTPQKKTVKPKKAKPPRALHKPKRLLRTVLSSLANSQEFGQQIQREAQRRRFFAASRKAYVADGLACNWTIHETHFRDFTPILDFTHAVTYLYRVAQLCCAKDEAWTVYIRWLTSTWRGQIGVVIEELRTHQARIGLPPEGVSDDDPREQLRLVIGYFENHRQRMRYDVYRCQGLPTTSAWMESAVKEVNYRVKGTEKFWNNPSGAEAILRIRAAALSDDRRLPRFLTRRPGSTTLRRPPNTHLQAA